MDNIGINLSFNQTGSYLIANRESKYQVYRLKPFEQFIQTQEINSFEDFELKYIEMYYSTNIKILIGKSKKKKLSKFIIFDVKEKTIINEEEIDNGRNIISIKINLTHIFILCDNCIFIYVFPKENMEKLFKTIVLVEKLNGLIAISENSNNNIIAYCNIKNEIIINHLEAKNKTIKIEKPHDEEITCICLNHNSTILASGSKFGKKVRLWSTNDGKTLKELLTTIKYPIANLAFSHFSNILCCIFKNGTINFIDLSQIFNENMMNSILKKNEQMNDNLELIKGERIKGYVKMKGLESNLGSSSQYLLSSTSKNEFAVINTQTFKITELYFNEKKNESKDYLIKF